MKKNNQLLIIILIFITLVGCITTLIISGNNKKTTTTANYKAINFGENIKYDGMDLEIINGKSFDLYVNKSGTIFINNVDTNIENDYDEFYVIDIDEDGIKEIITRTTEAMVSPVTNNYHIYKYFAISDYFEEVTTISIMGSINTFYIDGCDIKVIYNPFESPEDYIEEEHYSFMSQNYEISISPVYLNQPSNSLYLYENNYLITKSFSTNGFKDLVHYYQSYDININDIKKAIISESSDDDYFYKVNFKNDEKTYYLNEDSKIIKKIEKNLNYTGEIWYVTD